MVTWEVGGHGDMGGPAGGINAAIVSCSGAGVTPCKSVQIKQTILPAGQRRGIKPFLSLISQKE